MSFFRAISILFISIMLLSACQSKPTQQLIVKDKAILPAQGTVIMLHGLMRNSYAMRPVEEHFKALGYDVVNISYPSLDFDIPTLSDNYLAPEVTKAVASMPKPVHFVTHSLGGILLRYYLQNEEVQGLGRVVMLAPPNKGSEIVDSTLSIPFASPSPAALQLSADELSWVNQLLPVSFELGVIAGNYNKNFVTAAILPGPDDGVVSVKSTQVDNMKDFITVPLRHYRLRSNAYVLDQSAYFIQHGKFYRDLN